MMKDLTNLLQGELSENTTAEKPEKNTEKKAKKTAKKIENTVFEHENAQNNEIIVLENSEKTSEKNEEKTEEKNEELTAENKSDNLDTVEDLDGEDDEDFDDEDDEDFDDEDFDDEDDVFDGDDEQGETDGEGASDVKEQENDPLDQFAQPTQETKKTLEDLKADIASTPKNMKNLEKLSLIMFKKADTFKAELCSKISGEHLAEYISDEETRDVLIEAIKEYLATKEVKELSAGWMLVIAFGMWTLPSIGLAVWHRYENKKEGKDLNQNLNKAAAQGEPQKEYSHLKEYKEQRKIFSINKEKGTYNRTAKGTFVKKEFADETPSPEVMAWIEQDLTNSQIREKLGYE